MHGIKYAFLEQTLGAAGAKALFKAVEKSPVIESLLLPRTILSWIGVATQVGYNGPIPGMPNTNVSFRKHEWGYNGSIDIGNQNHELVDANLFQLSAAVAVALGADTDAIDPSLKDVDIVRLGKTIDLLVKSILVKAELAKKEEDTLSSPLSVCCHTCHTAPGSPCKWGEGFHSMREAHWKAQKKKMTCPECLGYHKKDVDKAENQGKSSQARAGAPNAGDLKPDAPIAQTGPMKQQGAVKTNMPKATGHNPAAPAIKSERSTRITKSQANRKCAMCGKSQFANDNFVGCTCLSALAKSIKSVPDKDGYILTFKALDAEEMLTVLDALRGA